MWRQCGFKFSIVQIVKLRARRIDLGAFIAGGAREKRAADGSAAPAKHRGLISRHGASKQRVRVAEKAFSHLVSEDRQPSTFARANDEIVPAVVVGVEPGHTRAALAELAREQWLTGEIVERFIVMVVIQH